ncbi:DUF2690 domain-containing protein [Streptomyces sp. NPDC017179]|uniref:helix-turn-helix domain-containing protein n=1 Tax=Streptomyces sp. NPDC017179 TaxID=3364979 RepID=UPI0037A2DB39
MHGGSGGGVTERKPLPDGLAPDVRHLVVELRALKDRAGLSLAALAHRTPHSKSSWERYLNGKALPPQHAVTSLGKLVDADPARLTALWNLASTAWHEGNAKDQPQALHATDPLGQPAAPPPAAEPVSAAQAEGTGPQQPAPHRFGNRPQTRSAAVIALVAVMVSAAALFGAFGRDSGGLDDRYGSSMTDTSTRQIDVTCFAESCEGKDPKEEGCGDVWTAALSKLAGVYVELRYSDACKAAWARISWGRPGDVARVLGSDGRTHRRAVSYDTDTFSAMVYAPSPSTARACVALTSGVQGCTGWGGTQHLTEAPNPPSSLPMPGATPSTTGSVAGRGKSRHAAASSRSPY